MTYIGKNKMYKLNRSTENCASTSISNNSNLAVSRNYNKILAPDWLSPAMIFGQIGQCNWTVHAITCAPQEGSCTFSLLRISGRKLFFFPEKFFYYFFLEFCYRCQVFQSTLITSVKGITSKC